VTSFGATSLARQLAVGRCLTGGAMLIKPDAVSHLLAPDETLPARWLVRLLGGRVFAQGLVEFAWPRRTVLLGGAAIDAAHAASMILATAVLPAHRRAAAASAADATLCASLGGLLAYRVG
jgi:hypothetical protein